MSKRILIFSTAYLPYLGGAEIAVKEITDRTPTIQFDLITARLSRKLLKRERLGNVNVYRLGIGLPVFDKYLLAFYGHKFAEKLNKKNNYDLIWAIMASYGGFAASFLKKRNPATPFLLTLQEGDDPEYISRRVGPFKKIFKDIFRRADHIQAISKFLADWARAQGAVCPIEVIPNGAKFDFKKDKDYEQEEGKGYNLKRWFNKHREIAVKDNLKKGDRIIITVSRLVEKNGIEYLIKAMEELPDNYKLRIVGGGILRDKLERLSGELLNQRIFFHGEVSFDDIRYEYEATAEAENDKFYVYSVFVRPSLSEGLGNVFFEAMSLSVPVIATPVGGIPDFLRNDETGWFCEVKNPHSIAEKIKYVFDDNNKVKVWKVVENAKKMVKNEYDWEKIAFKMRNLFFKYV